MEHEYIEEESSISLVEIFEIIKKKFWSLVVFTLIGGLILGFYAFRIAKPKYKSVGDIMVHVNVSGSEDQLNSMESQRLLASFIQLISDIDVIKEDSLESINSYGYNLSVKDVSNGLSVTNKANSLIISISYTSSDKDLPRIVVESIVDALIDFTKDTGNNDIAAFKDNIRDLKSARDAVKVGPNKTLLILVGLILGGTVGLITVFTMEMLNSGYKTKEELEKAFNINVIGEIPEYEVR